LAVDQRQLTLVSSGKSVARCHRTVLAYWKFESISLQRRVRFEPRGGRRAIEKNEINASPVSHKAEAADADRESPPRDPTSAAFSIPMRY